MGENQTAVPINGLNNEKHAILADIANKIQALDNPVKLNILSLLIEAGSLSITDIAKKLDINFSTAHKYLEQLEAAGLVASKQVADNRLKRIFTIKDFNIELSPKALFKKAAEADSNKSKAKFKIFDHNGKLTDFNEELFSQKYLKRGMPRGTIMTTLQDVLPQAYDKMTLLEARRLFKQALETKADNISKVLIAIADDSQRKRTFANALSILHPEALEMHADGRIFIRNLDNPALLNFVHDIAGIVQHGVNGKKPKTCKEFFRQIESVLTTNNYILYEHGLDDFNVALSEFSDIREAELAEFMDSLDKLQKKIFLGLAIGTPSYSAKNMSLAADIGNKILNIFKNKKYNNITPVLKIWDKKQLTKDFSAIGNFILVNMNTTWRKNASFVGGTIFDTSWRGEYGTKRVGLAQEIVINLARIAAQNKDKKAFSEAFIKTVRDCANFNLTMMELTLGEFLRNYKIMIPSEPEGSWLYARTMDFAYAISATGLNEAAKSIDLTTEDVEKMMKAANKELKSQNLGSIRLVLKENCNKDVAERFHLLDQKIKINTNIKSYTPGIFLGNFENALELQKFMAGGHACYISKKEYQEIINSTKKIDFGTLVIYNDN